MFEKEIKKELSRRQFVTGILAAGSLTCLGCTSLLAMGQNKQDSSKKDIKHKFQSPSNMSLEEVFRLAFQVYYIPTMTMLQNKIGKEKFIKMLKEASSAAVEKRVKEGVKNLPKNDMATFASFFKRSDPRWQNSLTFEIVEETDRIFEIKVTECIWAKTFLDAKAPEIGFAGICHADYTSCQAFNPKIKMIRDKTLMQGHDYCNHRYVFEV